MWALAGLSLVMILSVITNLEIVDNPSRNLSRIRYFIIGLLSIFALRAVFAEYVTHAKLKWLMWFFLISVSVASVSGLIGLWTGYNPLRMEAAHPTQNSGLHGMLLTYAYGLSLVMVMLSGVLFYGKKLYEYVPAKWFYLFYFINMVGLYFTYARGAWIGLAIGLPFLFFHDHMKKFLAVLTAFVMFFGILVFSVDDVRENFQGRENSITERVAYWQTAVKAVKERPVLGWGYRNFEPHVVDIKSRYPEIAHPEQPGHAHSNYFEMLASTGVVGFGLFLFFWVAWAFEMYRRKDLMGRLTFAYIASFSASGLFQFTFGDAPITAAMMGIFALSHAIPRA